MRKARLYAIAVTAWMACMYAGVHAQPYPIHYDEGGKIGAYVEKYVALAESGRPVVIDGECLSACTLVLGIVPRERLCATGRAVLGFHAAWIPGPTGKPVPSAIGTEALRETYPPHVNRWINQRGGLNGKMIIARGRDVHALVPACREEPTVARITVYPNNWASVAD